MKPRVKNPYQRAIITMANISLFSLISTLIIWGAAYDDNPVLIWIGLTFSLVFGLILLIVWLLGIRKASRAKDFLKSNRPLVSWIYSQAEWDQIREANWQEEKGDWKIQLGCLTALFALTGILAGAMIGSDDGFSELLLGGLIGLFAGGAIGVIIGGVVAGGNYVGAMLNAGQATPGQVAIGINEIYANDDYFKGNGKISYIKEAVLMPGNPATLDVLIVFPPRPRMPLEENWIIPIPTQYISHIEEILPRLTKKDQS